MRFWPSFSPSLFLVAALSLPAACGSASKPDDARGNVIVRDEHNYKTTADLAIPTVETAAATDLDICWSDVATDIQCHAVSAQADLDNVSLLRISHLSQEQVQKRLAAGTLTQSEVAGYLDFHTDHSATCTKLSALSFFGTLIKVTEEYVEDPDFTYLLLFSKGTTPGLGARAMTFIKPTATSTNTAVAARAGCGMLDFTADLHTLTNLPVPAAGPWVLDWRDITRDGQGNAVPFEKIDGVTIGFYAGKTPADLEAQIFDIEMIATTLWDLELSAGKTADLSLAKDRASGAAFTGFDRAETGTWMLALTCSRCQTPAPVVLAILAPGAGAP
jgi:hypothetical protein